MLTRTRVAVVVSALVLGFATQALAWPGLQGRDWDAKTIEISTGATVAIVATNVTVSADRGNTSRVDIYVNGQRVATSGLVGAAEAEARYSVAGNGVYKIEAVCSNGLATASSCKITTARVAVDEHY